MDAPADLSVVIETLRAALVGHGAVLHEPATENSLRETETRLGIQLPEALRQLYLAFDGVRTETKKWFWNIWPLGDLQTARHVVYNGEAIRGEATLQLYFCDANFRCPLYSVCVDPLDAGSSEVYLLFDDLQSCPCCSSAERFLEMLPGRLNDPLVFDDDHG